VEKKTRLARMILTRYAIKIDKEQQKIASTCDLNERGDIDKFFSAKILDRISKLVEQKNNSGLSNTSKAN
jgi:hypothetical protein